MDPFWQVIIGACIGGLLLNIFMLYKQYVQESTESGESQKLASWSIIIGLSGLIFFGITSVIGIIFALISMRGKKHRALSKIGLYVSVLTMLPWIVVIILGP